MGVPWRAMAAKARIFGRVSLAPRKFSPFLSEGMRLFCSIQSSLPARFHPLQVHRMVQLEIVDGRLVARCQNLIE
jgi:hypothetical protein